jgi:hypothetical protein
MSNKRWKAALKTIGALGLAMAMACGASASAAQSSPADRQRLVSITHRLEQAPLDSALKNDRAWAMQWLIEAPDITVQLCAEPLGGVVSSKYRYNPEIIAQDALAMAALLIEHPESANDPAAQHLAGAKSALNAYRAILKEKPTARSPILDALLQTEAKGGLPEFERNAATACAAHRGGK